MPIYKIRITSDTEEQGELLRQAFKAVFGDALTLSKARKGNNPKYAADPKFLAYGELELAEAELALLAGQPPAPATRSKPKPAYTQQTISLAKPKRTRKAR